jgi:hypothetical protein
MIFLYIPYEFSPTTELELIFLMASAMASLTYSGLELKQKNLFHFRDFG